MSLTEITVNISEKMEITVEVATGVKGDKGDQGDQGERGPQGPAGGEFPSGIIVMWSGLLPAIPSGWVLCLTGDSRVLLADGKTKPIKEIVEQKLDCEVLALDERSGEIKVARVVDWLENDADKEDVIRVNIAKGKGNGSRSLTCTKNHPVWTQRGWVKAEDLSNDDKVYRLWQSLSGGG